jgi:Caspase domain
MHGFQAVLSEDGASLRTAIRLLAIASFVMLSCLRSAVAAVERFAVVVGNNVGRPGDARLRYAEHDADRMYETLKGVGGFPPENVVLLKGERAPAVERALISTNDRIRATVSRPDSQAMLLVYLSAHADSRTVHLADTELDLRIIEQLVRSSAATFRVLVLDACRSGAVTRVKGGTPAPPFLARLEPQIGSQGAVFLTSSTSTEDAQESDELQGSFFTHFLVSALLGAGDTDNDGQVTLEEAYRYAYRWTLSATSRTWAGTQHPTFEYEVRGQGGIVITAPGTYLDSRAVLVFPKNRDYLVMSLGSRGSVVGEVPAGATARRLALRPGRYFVRGRASDYLLEGEIEAEVRRTTAVRDEDLRRVEYARLVRKGGGVSASHGPVLGYLFHTALRNATSWCQGGFAGYTLVLTDWDLGARVEACRSSFANSNLRATTDELAASFRIVATRDLSWISLNAGAAVGAAIFLQRFETLGAAPPRTSFGAHFGMTVGAAWDLPYGFNVFAEEALRTYLFSLADANGQQSSIEPSLAFQQTVGVSKYW